MLTFTFAFATINPTLPLGVQLAHLGCIAAVSAWIAWLWTHEEIFADCQNWLKSVVKANRALLKCEFFIAAGEKRKRVWRSIFKHWLKQKVAFGLTCQTCFVHYPSGFLVFYKGYHLVEDDYFGLFYAWMFIAFTGDSILWLLGIMRKSKVMEDNATRAISAGATLLEKKVDKDETVDVSMLSGRGGVSTDGVVRVEHSGPIINR